MVIKNVKVEQMENGGKIMDNGKWGGGGEWRWSTGMKVSSKLFSKVISLQNGFLSFFLLGGSGRQIALGKSCGKGVGGGEGCCFLRNPHPFPTLGFSSNHQKNTHKKASNLLLNIDFLLISKKDHNLQSPPSPSTTVDALYGPVNVLTIKREITN